jgi:hypothetical protein
MAALEPDLQRALRRKPAPEGFAERVLSGLPSDVPPQAHSRPARLLWAWSLAGAASLCLALGGFFANRYRIEQRNEAARYQLVESLTLASRQIVRAESKAFAGTAWARMKERVEQIETRAPDDDEPMHSPAPTPRI